jgi:hypothetical protein
MTLAVRSVTSDTLLPPEPPAGLAPEDDKPELDEAFVLQVCAKQSLAVEDAHKHNLFLTASQLKKGESPKKAFYDLVKNWAKLAGTVTPGVSVAGSKINPSAAVGAAAELMSSIEEVATKIKDRAEAELLSRRYLEGLETARGLAPESVRF